MRIGVDTGGTFTDCVVLDGAEIRILKVFSTPSDAARGILEGVEQLRRSVAQAGHVGRRKAAAKPEPLELIHGTTVGTNSLLERRGARVALGPWLLQADLSDELRYFSGGPGGARWERGRIGDRGQRGAPRDGVGRLAVGAGGEAPRRWKRGRVRRREQAVPRP